MITNRVLEVIITALSFVTIPIQIVTTFVLGILASLTFGLLLIPISIIWVSLFLGPLLGLSLIYEQVPPLRLLVSIIGIIIAIIGYEFCALMPSMGEKESRVSKMLLCNCFPYTWHCFQFGKQNAYVRSSKGYNNLLKILDGTPSQDKITWEHIIRMKAAFDGKTSIRN